MELEDVKIGNILKLDYFTNVVKVIDFDYERDELLHTYGEKVLIVLHVKGEYKGKTVTRWNYEGSTLIGHEPQLEPIKKLKKYEF